MYRRLAWLCFSASCSTCLHYCIADLRELVSLRFLPYTACIYIACTACLYYSRSLSLCLSFSARSTRASIFKRYHTLEYTRRRRRFHCVSVSVISSHYTALLMCGVFFQTISLCFSVYDLISLHCVANVWSVFFKIDENPFSGFQG